MILGWFFHGVFSHLFTGEHGQSLTLPQLAMHIASLTGTILIIVAFQNMALKRLFGISVTRMMAYYLLLPNSMFWVGYYLIGVPADILFHFLTLGLLNGIFMTKYLSLKRWTIFSAVSGIVGFILGAVILYPLEPYLNSFSAFTTHVFLFTSLGIVSGIPIAVFNGMVLAKIVTPREGQFSTA